MKFCFLAQLATAALLTFGVSTANAAIVIDLSTDTTNGTGFLLDTGDLVSSFAATPLTVAVVEGIPAGGPQTGTVVPGLFLSVIDGTGDTGAEINASGASLGVNAGSTADNTSRFESAFNESLTISFNQAIDIVSIELSSFTGTETFTVGDVTFGNGDANDSNVFTFSPGTASFAAGEGILLTAFGEVGIEGITIDVVAVPEPASATLIAVGAGAFGLVRRRRRI